jgi:hypothetical protein
VLRLDAVREQASPNMADVFAAALEEAPSEVAPSQGLAAAEPNVTEPKPVATAPIARAVVSVPRPAPASPRAPAVASPPEPSAPVAPSPMVPVVSSPAAPVVPAQVVSIDPAPLRVVGPSAADAGAVDVAPSPSVEAPSPRQASGEDDRATPESGAPPAVESNAAPVHEAARAPERAAQVQAEVRRPRAESRGGPPPPPVRANKAVEANEPSKGTPVAAKDGIGRTILLVVLAFAGAFLLVDRVIVPRLAPRETVAPLPPPSALVAKTRASAAVPAAPTLKLEALGIPAGVELGAGRGLIDVVGQEGDALYVDGTFVGRGPGRSVPLAAGSHEVRITRGDATQSLTVELAAGKRLRVSLPPSARPRPSP